MKMKFKLLVRIKPPLIYWICDDFEKMSCAYISKMMGDFSYVKVAFPYIFGDVSFDEDYPNFVDLTSRKNIQEIIGDIKHCYLGEVE